ncbi:MAG TPA: XrtA-associated tyrosine autokinase [Casimicrobiaceae bacterium]|nr:XrtA-associated tyrosine autokinase [Casimicrobiaceae bacterium]
MSSLIEEAAKRLEELRAAGVDTGTVDPQRAGGDAERPTPEAAVVPLDARKAAHHAAAANGANHGFVQRSSSNDSAGAERYIEIDFERLRARGFVTPDAGATQIAEEFRVIKRPIIRNAVGKGAAHVKNGNLVMVTSALPSEGKTFTSLNLALSIASEIDSTVLLVDGDVAHPSIPEQLGAPHGPGLLDLLTRDDLDFADALVKTNIDKLSVLPAGSRHRRSTELLASEQMASLLREIATRYSDRIIIFDSPPLLATTEARVLATNMGQIVMVVAADATTQHAVNQALSTIESCEIVMMVLNKASRTDVGTYYGYYANDAPG